jgi:polar amino acid transport system permease protein
MTDIAVPQPPPSPRVDDWIGLVKRPLRDPLQWITAVIVAIPLLALARSLWANPVLELPVIGHYLFDPTVLSGVMVTLSLAVLCLVSGAALGMVIVAMRLSPNPVLSTIARIYVWILRSVPPLVQILFWYNFGALYPRVTLQLPFSGTVLMDVASSDIIGSYSAAFIALTLVQAAYQAEIYRGGLLAAGYGQKDAALALGMSGFQAMRHVIFPQVVPVILPPTGNQFIHLVKSTSIVSFIALGDILYSVEYIYHETGKVIPLLVVAMLWYLAILGFASIGQARLERLKWRASA